MLEVKFNYYTYQKESSDLMIRRKEISVAENWVLTQKRLPESDRQGNPNNAINLNVAERNVLKYSMKVRENSEKGRKWISNIIFNAHIHFI